ncbi:MAG: RNA-binding cell elongation regulator Jag/EloR [Christensenella sp.]
MAFIEAKGKSVDEAILSGLEQLGLSLDEVKIDIIHEGGKGLFGIGKNAVVHLSEKGDETESEADRIISSAREERSAAKQEAKQDSADKKRENVDKKRENAEKKRENAARKRENKAADSVIEDKNVQTAAKTAGDSAPEVFLQGLFERMSLDAVCEVKEQDGKIMKIEIIGADTAVLIGRRGDTLDALQYLTGLAVNKGNDDYKKIMLDAENYREKRESTLEKLAKRLANTVAKTGKPITLEPMNPYERRILHATLQNHPRVETISEGEDPHRRVVIKIKRRG